MISQEIQLIEQRRRCRRRRRLRIFLFGLSTTTKQQNIQRKNRPTQTTQIYCCFWSLFVTVRLKRIKKFGLVNNVVVVVEFKREDSKQN